MTRIRGEQDRQRVAGRRGVRDVAAERAPVLDLGRTDRRGRLDQRRDVLAAQRGAADVGVRRQGARDEGIAVDGDAAQRIDRPQVDDARRRRCQFPGQRVTIRSVPPAIGRTGASAVPPASAAYASARSRGLVTGGSIGTVGSRVVARSLSAAARSAAAEEQHDQRRR